MNPSSFAQEFPALAEALRGQFIVERELGRGGMGVVWLAREVQLDRLVAEGDDGSAAVISLLS